MLQPSIDKPAIIQSDRTILLEVHSESFQAARADISAFCELVKSPEHIHTYRLTPLSLWNAASIGLSSGEIISKIDYWSKYPAPETVLFFIKDMISRFGLISIHVIQDDPDSYFVSVPNEHTALELLSRKELKSLIVPVPANLFSNGILQQIHNLSDAAASSGISYGFFLNKYNRGEFKLRMVKSGYPVDDRIPLGTGNPLSIETKSVTNSGYPFTIRSYQKEACQSFLGNEKTGYGTLVLPCGSGKTIIGIAVMEQIKTDTLIITTNIAAVHQWMHELQDKTNLTKEMIGEYSGEKKEIKPVTICTYQILTWRKSKNDDFPHFSIFQNHNWGLIIYDEVHVLPAPVFKVTSEIQAISRLGLTATLIREDNREDEVFSLVGPKRYDVPWKELEQKGWIAEAHCYEIRIPLPQKDELEYAIGNKRRKYRIAAENSSKLEVVQELITNHPDDYILIIGQYLSQLHELAKELKYPLITGATPTAQRDELFNKFRKGDLRILIVSKVANFAIDLPDASVAIQISGTFGSRQEEAQRLGRILRPKEHGSYFYSIVTQYTSEEEFAANRQKFLIEQGYKYHIEVWD